MFLLESLRTPPEAGVQHLVQIGVVALVLSERIVEFVCSLEPGEDQEDDEQLQLMRMCLVVSSVGTELPTDLMSRNGEEEIATKSVVATTFSSFGAGWSSRRCWCWCHHHRGCCCVGSGGGRETQVVFSVLGSN